MTQSIDVKYLKMSTFLGAIKNQATKGIPFEGNFYEITKQYICKSLFVKRRNFQDIDLVHYFYSRG